ncbi:hypothetical protein M595_1070 [Lyngbya aestuarii BL J]|uniref:Uncharacterized protein n=2 Tax=Lyngbya aestuarii TaxID=118322 RepID=U7QLZ9_9CYAN|nr:hypothetical protein M595_1070 [Lyngbya aestuarii BL J]
MRSLLRTWMRVNRRDRYGRAGFVLPTVTMVILVVVLLSVAILFRSMERAKFAQYRRVDEAAIAAAAPALDRAKAKIQKAIEDAELLDPRPRTTPPARKLRTLLERPDYDFADEDRLVLTDLKDPNNTITTGWRFPVDINNDGKIDNNDSYTLYGIFYSVPAGEERGSLDARAQPMPPIDALSDPDCAIQLNAEGKPLAGELVNWVKYGNRVKQSVFVYTTTVPIGGQGSQGFSALEYQQDLVRQSLDNNAVVYDGDLEIAPGPAFRLNGRIVANGNMFVVPLGGNAFDLFLISGENSCFYDDPENSKILIGGNVFNGTIEDNRTGEADVDLYRGENAQGQASISNNNRSTNDASSAVGNNSNAYETVIANLVTNMIADPDADDNAVVDTDPDDVQTLTEAIGRRKALEVYFRDRVRRLPFEDIAETADPLTLDTTLEGTGNELRPNAELTNPFEETNLTIRENQLKAVDPDLNEDSIEYLLGDRVKVGNNLPAKIFNATTNSFETASVIYGKWSDQQGNIIEAERLRPSQVTPLPSVGAIDRDGFWEGAAAQLPETPTEGFGGLRVITGAGIYDRELSFLPPPIPVGQTYDDPDTTNTESYTVVWPDTMPMSPVPGSQVYDNDPNDPKWVDVPNLLPTGNAQFARGDLRMRATAVYHYASSGVEDAEENDPPERQEPIACISSYYDPSTNITARNAPGLGWNEDPDGRSNNGIVYGPPTTARPGSATPGNNGLFTEGTNLEGTLAKQANMVFPDGRFANELLRSALQKADRSLAEQAAIDTAMCSLGILAEENPSQPQLVSLGPDPDGITNGMIYETAILDARQVKAVTKDDPDTDIDETFTFKGDLGDSDNLSTEYDLPLEERQPLEVRLTILDLDQMRKASYSKKSPKGPQTEYILPMSGVVYASREDALPDWSHRVAGNDGNIDKVTRDLVSRTDFKLDPSRRPNGIMLVNGEKLARGDNQASDPQVEKGLLLASNNPVYIKGDFNLHTQEEFTSDSLSDGNSYWNNFYGRTGRNGAFACRQGQDGCDGQGDEWRPAKVLADALNILSADFRPGYRNEGDFDLRSNAGSAITYSENGSVASDFDGNGAEETVDEDYFDLDFNGNGNATDDGITITAKVARLINGFHENNFVTNGLSSGGFRFDNSKDPTNPEEVIDSILYQPTPVSGTALNDKYYVDKYIDNQRNANSSYFNNFITPVQRRAKLPEYVMEICRKPMISACGPDDWFVGRGTDQDNDNKITLEELNSSDIEIRADQIPIGTPVTELLSGTTARQPLDPDDQRFPRRVAFLRYPSNANEFKLFLDANNAPVPLGIDGGQNVNYYPYSTVNIKMTSKKFDPGGTITSFSAGVPATRDNALWFRTTTSRTNPSNNNGWQYNANNLYYESSLPATGNNVGTVQQPLLVPVMQIYATTNTNPGNNEPGGNAAHQRTKWVPRARNNTTFNMVMAVGDVPSRAGETNGGLQNLPRLLENWQGQNNSATRSTFIQGSFMQLFRSAYATAPYLPVRNPSEQDSLFRYKKKDYNTAGGGRTPQQSPPSRQWGFDVGLLFQYPDLFSSLFTTPITDAAGNRLDASEEYLREVSRSEPWVRVLYCSQLNGSSTYAATNSATKPNGCD